jgi:HSP20 family protein
MADLAQTCYDADLSFTRWDPLRDLLAMQARLDRLTGAAASGWLPPIDIYETPDRFVIVAELPGMSREQIRVDVQGDQVTLSGEQPARAIACEHILQIERGHGRFSRRFALGGPIDAGQVSADLKEGVLTVTLPKLAPRGPQRIDVQ